MSTLPWILLLRTRGITRRCLWKRVNDLLPNVQNDGIDFFAHACSCILHQSEALLTTLCIGNASIVVVSASFKVPCTRKHIGPVVAARNIFCQYTSYLSIKDSKTNLIYLFSSARRWMRWRNRVALRFKLTMSTQRDKWSPIIRTSRNVYAALSLPPSISLCMSVCLSHCLFLYSRRRKHKATCDICSNRTQLYNACVAAWKGILRNGKHVTTNVFVGTTHVVAAPHGFAWAVTPAT